MLTQPEKIPESDNKNAAVVSCTMDASELIALLAQHRCPNISDKIDLGKCGRLPVSGGGYGDIYQGALIGGGSVAIKCPRLYIKRDDKDGRKILKHVAHELYVWSRLKHKNVLELCGLATFRDHMAMVSPWIENGTLLQYIKRDPNTDRHRLCVDIAEGVAYLHQNEVVHGDIKGANVLIAHDGVAKLADFGCTQFKKGTLYFTTTTSPSGPSPRWTAPEILSGSNGATHFSKESDVYALGMTLLEVVTGEAPFSGMTDIAVINVVVWMRRIPERPKVFRSFVGDEENLLWKLITDTWAYTPSDRPNSGIVKTRLKAIKRAYFIIYPNIYYFNSHRIIYQVDSTGEHRQVNLKRNPPLAGTEFSIEGISFWIDSRGELLHHLSGEWHWKPTYPDLESAKVELTRSTKKGSNGSNGKKSDSGRPDPRHKPEDLKDPMYFLVGAKTHPCGCPATFPIYADKEKHMITCTYRSQGETSGSRVGSST